MSCPIPQAFSILDTAIAEYKPTHFFALFSGGNDSLCSTHVASNHPRFGGVVHIHTGMGVEATRQFVRDTCRSFAWPLSEYVPPVTYEELVLKYGFPGPALHSLMYNMLKDRCLRLLVRQHKRSRRHRIMLITGVRRSESERRMGTVAPVMRQGCRVWTAPLVDWTAAHIAEYVEDERLPRNPVVEKLGMSGECLCGAFAKPGKLDRIAQWYPDVAKRIRDLERRADAAGVHAVWGTRPRSRMDAIQLPDPMSLCWSCAKKDGATQDGLIQLNMRH